MRKRIFPVLVCCLLLVTTTVHADVWGNQRLGDSIAATLATMLMFAYTILFLIVVAVAALSRQNTRSKAMIVYTVFSLVLYLLFFIWLAGYFHDYPKSFGRILTEGPSEGTLHVGWMNIVSFIAMLLSITRLVPGFWAPKERNTW
ncbi:hypothetical protein [Taibaiella koreensis]|uniref:hypothetical protein n=1 Tax=Taibaiella koreensis TaxID=1268548 RepID=UPI000E59B237|nr:hypothetical protein [Taibaiella koreensis]